MALTPRIVAYLGSEEGMGLSAYYDDKGIATWAIGIAASGGHDVRAYFGNPQPIDKCLKASIDLLAGASYLGAVLHAFPHKALSEPQLAAALSFQWRTGRIAGARWVQEFNAGNIAAARADIMQWTDHGAELTRCTRERDLFFAGTWPADMRCRVFVAQAPKFQPIGGKMVDLIPILQQIMGGH